MKINQKIPEGWNIVFLNSLSSKGIMNGIFNNPTKVGKGVPLINVVDLYNDKIDIDRLSLLDVSEDELKRYEAITGDLLFTRSSLKLEGIAQCNIVPTKNSRCVFDCHIMRIRPNDQLVVPYYLFAYCNTAIAKIQFMKLSKTTTMTTIDQDGLGQLKVLLPPLAEQEKIAGILGTWDEAIEKLSSLIEQKKLLKKGLMQKLLTGKTRLNGFTQPWKDIELSDLLNYEQPSKYLVGEILPYDKNKIPVLTANKAFILGSTDDSSGIYTQGDCIIFDDFTTDIKYVNFPFKVKSSAIKILTPKTNTNLKFVYEQMKCIKYPLAGHKRYYLSEYQYITISIPDISEQQAIADVLSTADDEINLLNQKLEALKEQKKGLMQQLLTGQTRVKVN